MCRNNPPNPIHRHPRGSTLSILTIPPVAGSFIPVFGSSFRQPEVRNSRGWQKTANRVLSRFVNAAAIGVGASASEPRRVLRNRHGRGAFRAANGSRRGSLKKVQQCGVSG
jgi:hypothetical protein